MNKQEAIKRIEQMGEYENFVDEAISKKSVLNIISQIDEPQKPKVLRVAVEFYEKYKDENLSLDEWFSDFYSKEAIEDFPRMEELSEWLYDNDNETNRRRELALATLVTLGIDAVEIEQDKLYTVEIPNPNINAHTVLRKTGDGLVLVTVGNVEWTEWESSKLTESEIKQDFEWAFQFAKEVEGWIGRY